MHQISIEDAQATMAHELHGTMASVSGKDEHKSLEVFSGLQGVRYEVWNERQKVLDTRSLELAVEAYNAPHMAAEIALREPKIELPHLAVIVENGVVSEIVTPLACRVSVLDRDVNGCSEAFFVEGIETDLQQPDVCISPERLAAIQRSVDAGQVWIDAFRAEIDFTTTGDQFRASATGKTDLYEVTVEIWRSDPDNADEDERRKCEGFIGITPHGGEYIELHREWECDEDTNLATFLDNDVLADLASPDDIAGLVKEVQKPALASTAPGL